MGNPKAPLRTLGLEWQSIPKPLYTSMLLIFMALYSNEQELVD